MSNELRKAVMMAQNAPCTPNKEPVRIPIQIFRASGPLQDGPDEAVGTTNEIYGGVVNGVPTGVESSQAIWVPGLLHKTIQIIADYNEILTNPVRVQVNILGSSEKGIDWVTLPDPIISPGIYKILGPSINKPPIYMEPEVTLLRLIGSFDQEGSVIPLPRSLNAVVAALWLGEGKWTMRCTANYSRS